MKKGKWRTLAMVSALLLIGSGAAQAQVKVRGSVFGGGEKANVTGTDTVRIHGSENDTVLGNVYGGGLEGQVSVNTVVEVSGGVIGTPGKTQNGTQYGIPVIPVANGGRVFGGGEGTTLDRTDGWVAGNTFVTISGTVQVLRNVYGGGELASVGSGDLNDKNSGVATVTIEGGVVGPLDGTGTNGYVFAGGRGYNDDNDAYWNFGNVDSASLVMTGGTIYGSLFGGAEDGHVIGDATVSFSGGSLGTTGKTSWDGNIFGGGRNYEGKENTSGRVGGNIHVNVSGTTGLIMGNVFGGGRYSSVGIKRTSETNPTIVMQDGDDHGNIFVTIDGNTIGRSDLDTVTSGSVIGGCRGDVGHLQGDLSNPALGHAKNTYITINGGHVLANVLGGSAFGTLQNDAHITMNDGEIGRVIQSPKTGNDTVTSGNVYGGGRGYVELNQANGIENGLYGIVLGDTYVNVNGGLVHNNVYGGGKNGTVGTYDVSSSPITTTNGTTHVTVMGGTIGSSVHDGMNGYVFGGGQGLGNDPNDHYKYAAAVVNTEVRIDSAALVNASVFGGGAEGHVWDGTLVDIRGGQIGITGTGTGDGSVFGGGGNMTETNKTAGRVGGNTHVIVSDSAMIFNNVYGGGYAGLLGVDEDGHVYTSNTADHGNTLVEIKGGIIGADKNGTIKGEGNVFAGGEGSDDGIEYGLVRNSEVRVSGGHVFGNVNGGGEMASVGVYALSNGELVCTDGGEAVVSITGGQVGNPITGETSKGYVYGGGKGKHIDPSETFKHFANVKNTTVTVAMSETDITNNRIWGSVYGGGSDGHVLGNTDITITSGVIGTDGSHLYEGNVFGAGRNELGQNHTNGRVGGTTTVTMNGGHVKRNVYGGGKFGLTGVECEGAFYTADLDHHGKTNVYINGGQVGTMALTATNTDTIYGGNVFGSGRGNVDDYVLGETQNTNVNISGADTKVLGNVYGGGEMADVLFNTNVTVNDGTIGVINYSNKQGNTGATLDTIIHLANSGMVFGGGKGVKTDPVIALVEGNTNVNIEGGHVLYNVYGGGEMASVGIADTTFYNNTIKDLLPKSGGYTKVTVKGGQVGPAPKQGTEGGITYDIPIGLNGIDGYVYGGGKGEGDDEMALYPIPHAELYKGFANVNNTCVIIDMPMPTPGSGDNANRIWGSVFGGAEDGHVLGSDTVRYINGLLGTMGTTSYDGNIFGGGRNYSKKNYTAGRVRSNITVEMYGGQIYGSIFGGGRLGITGLDYNGNLMKGADYGNTTVIMKGGEVGNPLLVQQHTDSPIGDIFGGGKGDMVGIQGNHPEASALLLSLVKNTEIIIADSIVGGNIVSSPIVYGSVFGGGEVANVGEYSWSQAQGTGEIYNIKLDGYGLAKITVSGGRIGPDKMRMSYDPNENTDIGHVFGGGEGIAADPDSYPTVSTAAAPIAFGDISLLNVMATVGHTEVTIKDNAWVKGSVYGGAENGHVLGKTVVKVKGGQIGSGETAAGTPERKYTEDEFETATDLADCPHWPFGYTDGEGHTHFYPYDPLLTQQGKLPSDGHTWFGNVFGGGSGYYPYIKNGECHWNPYSGWVQDSTRVEITGGHILTNVYGGSELIDVAGDSTIVVMSGGTVGVPRTASHIAELPLTGYLFGAGKGDPRFYFDTWTNVQGVRVEVTGGWIYGSVMGGGEEGHVHNDVKLIVSGNTGTNAQAIAGNATKIGTLGYTSFDGNVFGAGRGFTGEALTSGVVGGNVTVNIRGGQMLGSVFGGGRLASVGTEFANPTTTHPSTGNVVPNPHYGHMVAGDDHGVVTVNISGGVIGNEYESVTHHFDYTEGGNVFGGGMGRILNLDNTVNLIWPDLDRVKRTTVNVSGTAVIMGSVYGGGEHGTVEQNAVINVMGGTIWRDVYGAGHGSDDVTNIGKLARFTDDPSATFGIIVDTVQVTPMEWAGRVKGNTNINVSGGWIKKCVYGGGELASVGSIEFDQTVKHEAPHPFNISWPYEFVYKTGTGTATVNVTGGRIGITGKDYMGPWSPTTGNPYDPTTGVDLTDNEIDEQREDNGDLYGGGKGIAADRYEEGLCANVDTTKVIINITNTSATPANYKDLTLLYDCVTGAVYGGGENGHVYTNAYTTLNNGLIGHAIYGGGKGKGKYSAQVLNPTTGNYTNQKIYSVTAGKVYGNTYININGGQVVRSVFGGGNLASVGVGNYAGGVGDYNTYGYGEVVSDPAQWADTTGRGHTYVNVLDGTIGMLPINDGTNPIDPASVFKDGIPYGSVFGGCRGMATPDVTPSEVAHLFESRPDVFLSYVNHTHVKIGDGTSTPRLYGSVFGGAQDGHIRWNSNVVVNSGEIGARYGSDNVGSSDINSVYWTDRGNVFGGGSGIGTYKDEGGVEHNSSVAGSVTQKAHVIVNGGTIHRNVYGGGNMATIGPPRDKDASTGVALIDHDCPIDKTCVTVDINANATIGVHNEYGGNVYGASRGKANPDSNPVQQFKNFALCSYTVVNINGANILKNVYGGGENGQVGVAGGDTLCHTTTVNLNDGLIGTSTSNAHIFGGGQGVWGETGYENDTISGRVMGTATVNINGGEVTGNVFGGGQLGVTYGETYANISGGTVDNHVFGGALGKTGQIHVYGLRMTNMRKGLVKGNVYGGSYNADDALLPHPAAFASNNSTETVSLVNYSGGTAMKHVFGAGDHGKTYGSTYVFVGTNAIMNAPHHTATTASTGYNEAYYADHGDLIIHYDVWAGADFGESNTGTFGPNTITGRSDVYVDGYGYDTENTISQGNDDYMVLYRSIFGCGTLNDGGRQGKQIMIRNYGHVIDNTGSSDPEQYINATRQLVAIQYADSLIVESSHIRLQGRGIVNHNIATEEYAMYNIFDKVRVVNGSSLFVDKPVNNIGNLYSNLSSNLNGLTSPTSYPNQPVYTEVNYDGLTTPTTDNKIRINHGGYLTVSMTTTNSSGTSTVYGALRGFFHLMTDGVYNAFAYARPKQSNETGNMISPDQSAHAYNYDGGFVSYRPEVNIYDPIGTLVNGGNSVQMRYENHTPNQRGSNEIYFRVWRFSEQAASVLDVVLHAISQPGNPNGFTYYTGTLTLPPRVNDGSIFRVRSNNGVAEINYGSEIALVNAGFQEEGTNWMYYNGSSFVMNQPESATGLDEGQDFMAQHPNNVFGLVAIPTGGLVATTSQPNQTMLICNESNPGIVNTQWHNTVTTAAPQVQFVLTHNNHITGNYSWDPISITMEQVDGTTVTDVVDVHVRIVTTTSIEQPNEVNTYAMMNHGAGSGDHHDVYRAKILLPAYQLIAGADTSAWTLKSVKWMPNDTLAAPNGDKFNTNTLVAGEPYDYCAPYADSLTRNFVGMTLRPTANVDNVVGWWNDYTQIAPIDLGRYKMTTTNPVPSGGIYLGSTRGENPISFEFDLHYDSQQNIGLAGNAEMGTLLVTLHFTNYVDAEGKDVQFYVQVSRRGKGKGFYIDGVNGQFQYSGSFPDAAQPSFAGILYFADDYEPVDSIYIVNKITINPPVHLDWSTPYDEIRFYRYNGGHPLYQDEYGNNGKYFAHYCDAYLHPDPDLGDRSNPAYKDTLVDVLSTMNIKSASVDGAYTLPELVGRPKTENSLLTTSTQKQYSEHVVSDAPMFHLRQGAILSINGANDHPSILRNNYNKSSNGGAANLEAGAKLMMNQQAYIDDNYVQDGASEVHHGGGVYLEGDATVVVSDDVRITTNKHVSANRTDPDTVPQNVYLNDYVTTISVGTGDGTDTYGALDNTSRIGVTKTAWDGLEYMPVVYTEYNPHGDNLISDSHYHDGQIVFDQDEHYGLYTYPMRKANNDPLYQHKLYWVKTWTDVVTERPDGFPVDPDPGDIIEISTPQQLAWAISYVNGLNGQSTHPAQKFTLTDDIDMSQYIWVPIGSSAQPYNNIFEGNGHLVNGLHSPFPMTSKGMFGYTGSAANIRDLQAVVDFYGGETQFLGGLIGHMSGGILANCESAGYLENNYTSVGFTGGLVGKSMEGATIHSSFAVDTLYASDNDNFMGGLVGNLANSNLFNSYSRFVVGEGNQADSIGGLVGYNAGQVENCYADLGSQPYPAMVAHNEPTGKVYYSYANYKDGIVYIGKDMSTTSLTGHGTFGTVKGLKEIGYMYDDNKVTLANGGNNAYVPADMSYENNHTIVWNGLLSALNTWVKEKNASTGSAVYSGKNFSSWFRPTSVHINADLPVLAFPMDSAMATLDVDGRFLRYNDDLDRLLVTYADKTASIFLYGTATEVAQVPTADEKVFINEDAVLLQASTAGNFINTTVGVTFDNSSKAAEDYYHNTLLYDWHLMSTPLRDAKMGTTYGGRADADYGVNGLVNGTTYLPDPGSTYNYETSPVDIQSMVNGYFPNGLTMGSGYDTGVKWDFYCYYEPEYHWINLKRNKKNHFHRDAQEDVYVSTIPFLADASGNPAYRHYQIQYPGLDQSDTKGTYDDGCVLTPGKGYMMAISQDSYLSNSGTLNKDVTIELTAQAPLDDANWLAVYPSHDKGSNLVGNPYQAYLDLDKLTNATGLNRFWTYDADNGMYTPYTSGASVNPIISSSNIHPHQAFFVITDYDQDLTFTPSMAGTTKDEFSYFRGRPNYPLVNLIVSDEDGNRDLAIVEFNRPEVGGVQKIENLQNADFKLYARFEDESYGLLFTPQGTQRVPVFFKTPNSGTYTLRWDKYNGVFNRMRLIDNITGVDYDMLANDHYTFQAFNTDYAARFYIVFDVTGVDEIDDNDDNFAYFNGTGWAVEGQGVIQLVDMVGHVLYSDYLSGESTVVNFGDVAAGVYLLKLGNKTQKIVIL